MLHVAFTVKFQTESLPVFDRGNPSAKLPAKDRPKQILYLLAERKRARSVSATARNIKRSAQP